MMLRNWIMPASPIKPEINRSLYVPPASFGNYTAKEDPNTIKLVQRGETELKEYTREQFEAMTGVEYLPALDFKNEKTLQRIQGQCKQISNDGSLDQERKWLGAFYSEQIRSHYVADVSIRWIDNTLGYGLFAEKEIQAWEFVGEYTGVVRKRSWFSREINDYCFLYPTSVFGFQKHLIDGLKKGNEIRFANHSTDPNCESISIFCDGLFHMILRAIKHIPAGAQITYDYGERYWKAREFVPNVI